MNQEYRAEIGVGKNEHPTAGSFVRPTRPSDEPLTVTEAIRKKYASDTAAASSSTAIHISGKEVEEVGFEKIRQQLANFQILRIVLVDQLCVVASAAIAELCPNTQELDLSRNLFEDLDIVYEIIAQLSHLKSLRIDGNRFRSIEKPATFPATWSVTSLSFLSLDDTLLEWYEVCLTT